MLRTEFSADSEHRRDRTQLESSSVSEHFPLARTSDLLHCRRHDPSALRFHHRHAVDGDTIKCDGERVRLERIDTPERHEAGFQEAKDHMALLIRGKEVRCRVRKRDRYGRLLGECRTDQTPSLCDEMLALGLAEIYRRKP